MTASAGSQTRAAIGSAISKAELFESISRLSGWLQRNDYRGYDTFDGLNAKFLRPFTILRDLDTHAEGDALCISYVPFANSQVHNSNTLGGSLLARTYVHTGNEAYRTLAQKSMLYTASHQRPDGSWYYGEYRNLHWVDNFHTGYVLDCFKHYSDSIGDHSFDAQLMRGYEFWKNTFFLEDGTPRYYDHKTLPIDIQCSSQAIDTLVFFRDRDPESLKLASKVAEWTIENMQDRSGYFYYRRYSSWLVNKAPTLHWGQATMFCALAGLYKAL